MSPRNPFAALSTTSRARAMQHRIQMRARNARRPATILGCLNSHQGFNIWQDVILLLPGYEEDATTAVDGMRCDSFVADGLVYRFNQTDRQWQQIGAVS